MRRTYNDDINAEWNQLSPQALGHALHSVLGSCVPVNPAHDWNRTLALRAIEADAWCKRGTDNSPTHEWCSVLASHGGDVDDATWRAVEADVRSQQRQKRMHTEHQMLRLLCIRVSASLHKAEWSSKRVNGSKPV